MWNFKDSFSPPPPLAYTFARFRIISRFFLFFFIYSYLLLLFILYFPRPLVPGVFFYTTDRAACAHFFGGESYTYAQKDVNTAKKTIFDPFNATNVAASILYVGDVVSSRFSINGHDGCTPQYYTHDYKLFTIIIVIYCVCTCVCVYVG